MQHRSTRRRCTPRLLLCTAAIVGVVILAAGCLPTPSAPAPDLAAGSPGTPAPPVSPASTFPTAATTGVRAGATLTQYTGPLTIRSCGVVIDSKIVTGQLDIQVGNGTHSASTPCVTVTNSLVRGIVNSGYAAQGYGPVLLQDVEIAAPNSATPSAALLQANWYAWRVNIHGGGHGGAQCDGFCELHDSYLHDYYFVSGVHYNAFGSNGNAGRRILLDHNTLACGFVNAAAADGNGGCSATVGYFGDFDPVSNVTMTRNLLVANPRDFYYCVYTGTRQPGKAYPSGANNTWSGNTFERGSMSKCGSAGPVYDWSEGNGNVWSGNVWDDGAPLNM